MARTRKPGVFCIEGPWSASLLDRSTFKPVLDLLDGLDVIRFAHRDAATIEEFELYLRRWTQKQYATLEFGYLAFHGDPGGIYIGRRWYSLERLAELLRGRCDKRVLYFGSCATLDVDRAEVEAFREVTKARAVCGYTEEVDMIESAAFELNLIAAVTNRARIDTGFKELDRDHGGACERLGFRALWKSGGVW
jgi:hypothetical protein